MSRKVTGLCWHDSRLVNDECPIVILTRFLWFFYDADFALQKILWLKLNECKLLISAHIEFMVGHFNTGRQSGRYLILEWAIDRAIVGKNWV